MTHPHDSSLASDSDSVQPSWRRLLGVGVLVVLVSLALLTLVIVGLTAVIRPRPIPLGIVKHELITAVILLPIVLALVLVGTRIRSRPRSFGVGVSAWVIMGVGLQLQWYGTPQWSARYGIVNVILAALWFAALGGALHYVAARRGPNRSARFAARIAAFEAVKRARATKDPTL